MSRTARAFARPAMLAAVMLAASLAVAGAGAGAATAAGGNVIRLAGPDRYGTAVAVSQASYPGAADAVVLARGGAFPDALVGATLANARNAPLLLTEGAAMPGATKAEIARVLAPGGAVYVLGGVASVPASIDAQLSAMGYQVTRYAGADRYGTATAVAEALGSPSTVFLADGQSFADALSAGPAAASQGGVLLLTGGSTMPPATAAYLAAHPGVVWAIGSIAHGADPAARIVGGQDIFATSAAVATTFFRAAATVGIATGAAYADALAGGAQAARSGGPMLLVNTFSVPTAVAGYLTAHMGSISTARVYGGTAAVSDGALANVQAALAGTVVEGPIDWSGMTTSCVAGIATIEGTIRPLTPFATLGTISGGVMGNPNLISASIVPAADGVLVIKVVARGHLSIPIPYNVYQGASGVQTFNAC